MIQCGASLSAVTDSPRFATPSPSKSYQSIVDSLCEWLCANPNNTSVHIKDINKTKNKLKKLISGGSRSLQVISDFDHTMSKHKHNGVLIPTCHGIFDMDPELTDAAKTKLRQTTKKYYPIEVNPDLSETEKIPHMIDWWEVTHKTMVECRLHRDTLARTVKTCGVVLRDGVPEFTKLLFENDIPLLVFSAGIGDVIELILENFSIYTSNMRVVSNFMEFSDEGLLIGFTSPIIHTFNKTAASITNGDYTEVSSNRQCVLLLGDSFGDVHMADGATTVDSEGISGTVLRIGFLNLLVESSLEKYKSLYDIVLVNDDTFSVPLTIIQHVLQYSEPDANVFCSETNPSSDL